jgi:succinate dehydrogenase/fumarate reductase flavoprotein subunit
LKCVDVVVVGGGGAGVAAAVAARTAGASVVLLEKNTTLGGTTARSIGSISATQTSDQKRMGIVDTPAEHFEDMGEFSKHHADRADNDELARILCEHVPESVRLLEEWGAVFLGPMDEPPHRKPRMHQIMPNSSAYIFHAQKRARKMGVEILTGARAIKLVSANGEVTGVELERDGRVEVIDAARGVVLASGDYAADPGFKAQFVSEAVAATEAVNPTNTGDGHRMALALGARIINPDMYGGGMRFVRPARPAWQSRLPPSAWLMRLCNAVMRHAPQSLVRHFIMSFMTTVMVPERKMFQQGAILINARGERFADENQRMVFELTLQPDGLGYILLDAATAAKFTQWPNYVSTAPGVAFAYLRDYERTRPDLFRRGESLDDVARVLKFDAAVLRQTVAAYNQGAGPPGRGNRPAVGEGPYVVLGPVKNFINYTDGGLAVNARLQVLGRNDAPIPRLYAAGATGQGGLLLKGHGNHIGWGFTSGRLAGQHAAALAPRV